MKIRPEITAEELRDLLDYNALTGIFRWRNCPWNRRPRGSVAGCLNQNGYWHIVIYGHGYKAHRLAWLYVYGKWPSRLDHRDRNTINNAIDNLREATHSQNMSNTKLRADNQSGFKGVALEPTTQKWVAYIDKNKVRYYLGLFETPEKAAAARADKAQELHQQFIRIR